MARHGGRTLEQVEADFFRDARPTSLIRRFAEPEEVANLAVYLASPKSSATTGAAMRVDGGTVNFIA
jgi:NAD(P)-dependent dehydrogenase (short-subunit alcohol dehydrogenase family)